MEIPIIGFIIGVIFGACLVLSGLTNPDKIINAFKLKDFHIIRTIAVFILVGMLGTWLLGLAGSANLHIKPAAIPTVIIGGTLVGLGIGLTCYCPSTSLACAGSGRIYALTATIGMFLGAHTYILIYPLIVMPLEKIFNYGRVTLPQITNTSLTSWIIPISATESLVLFLTRPRESKTGTQKNQIEDSLTDNVFFSEHSPKPIPKANDSYLTISFFKAARTLRIWKNLLFIVITLCLLLLQTSFWLTRTGHIEIATNTNIPAISQNNVTYTNEATIQNIAQENPSAGNEMKKTTNESNNTGLFDYDISFEHVTSIVHIINTILVLTSALYVLTIFLCLSTSFGGKLGSLSQISKAFISSMILFILLFPWQIIFKSTLIGVVYSPHELYKSCLTDSNSIFSIVLLFLRFTGYWFFVVLLLMKAQIHSWIWSKAVLRRLWQVS